jgi:soluble lytic murein transglycosylase-like protein
MPFWTREIGVREHNLFHLRTNLRYGCTVLRHYLDIERGSLFRALGRYNGSLGRAEYPNMVVGAWHGAWAYSPKTAQRAGLDPQLVLSVIQHESAFRKYAVSSAGARGYMQVMPFWTNLIGAAGHNLFHLRTNLRYGCVILRHYLDVEGGDLYRALGRYNGSLGRPEYPTAVLAVQNRNWQFPPAGAPTKLGAAPAQTAVR